MCSRLRVRARACASSSSSFVRVGHSDAFALEVGSGWCGERRSDAEICVWELGSEKNFRVWGRIAEIIVRESVWTTFFRARLSRQTRLNFQKKKDLKKEDSLIKKVSAALFSLSLSTFKRANLKRDAHASKS